MPNDAVPSSRRDFLRTVFLSAGGACLSSAWTGRLFARPVPDSGSPFQNLGALQAPDAQGIRLPSGWSSRIVAVSGEEPVPGCGYRWHVFPDGGATFRHPDGGWVYANNSETSPDGGVGALRFDARGEVVDAWSLLSGTRVNCAGGPTPWGTWLSCEEHSSGMVWECQPLLRVQPRRSLPALGRFSHEAVAVDPAIKTLYLTEDDGAGRFYRFVPDAADWPQGARRPLLQSGRLQVLRFRGLADDSYPPDSVDVSLPHVVEWVDVQSPSLPQEYVRNALGRRAPGSVFKGGEGLWYFEGLVYFSTKGDNRIWAYDAATETLQAIYHFASADAPDDVLSGVDNLTVSAWGDVLVAEDGGNMELCAILPDGRVEVVLQLTGQDASEITGPAFSPDGRRLYFNSQRGGLNNGVGRGLSYEVRLP